MSFYGQLQATAHALILDKGRTLPIKRISKTFDPITSQTSAATKVEGEITAVIVPFNTSDKNNMDERFAEALRTGKLRKLIISAVGFSPALLDIITLDGLTWSIAGLTPLNPAGTALIYYAIIEVCSISSIDAAATGA